MQDTKSASPPAAVAPEPVATPLFPTPPAAVVAPAPAIEPIIPGPVTTPQGTPSLTPFLTGRPSKTPLTENAPGPPPVLSWSSSVRVALLLPLTGTNAELGKAMLNAAQLAVFAFADDRFELLIHDTRGTPDGAADAASLAIGDGSSLILGPLLSSSVNAVAPAARAANVTVVAFSSDRTVSGDGIFTMGFLPSAEVERVVAYARSQGISRFAALAPDDVYGQTVVEALRRAAAMSGANVTRVQFYDPGTSDFSGVVRRLANYDARRQALLSQRKELRSRDDEVARRALARLAKLQTVGKLPFDALLVADGDKRLQAIAAHLPFYDVDPAKIRMLGTGRWDEPGIGAEPALVGGWFAAPPPAARADFERQYEQVYGRRPPRLATLAYDAAALAAVLSQAEGGADFSSRALTAPSGFYGRDGIFRFLPEGIVERGLAVLQVLERGAKVVGPPPEAFAPPTH